MNYRTVNKFTIRCEIKVENYTGTPAFITYSTGTEFDYLEDAIKFAKIICQWENAKVTLYGSEKGKWEEYPVLIEI